MGQRIKCKKCGEIIEGDGHGTFIWCKCKSCGIDEVAGGYARLIGNTDDYEVLGYKEVKDV